MNVNDKPNNDPPTSRDTDDFEAQLKSLRQTEFKNRLKWTIIGLLSVSIGVGLFAMFWNNQTFWFRPKPDMVEVEKISFEKSNDPVCRELISAIDKTEAAWREQRLGLKDLYGKTDASAIKEGIKQLQGHQEVFNYERRRVRIIVTKDSNRIADMSRYIKHISGYLKQMERALGDRLAELDPNAAPVVAPPPKDTRPDKIFVEGFGELKLKKRKADKRSSKDKYATGWSKVAEDYEKWRVFRQYALPCGKRVGEPPPVPAEDALDFSESDQPAPKNPAKEPAKAVQPTPEPTPVRMELPTKE